MGGAGTAESRLCPLPERRDITLCGAKALTRRFPDLGQFFGSDGPPRGRLGSQRRFADPTRRAMVERLVRGPASVSELSQPLAMSLPAVMQHLQVLQACGLVRSEKACGVRTCHIEPGALRAAEGWITSQRTAWESRLWARRVPGRARHRRPCATRHKRPRAREQLTMDRYVTHATFSLERSYPVPLARVFAAWSDPAAKARWFATGPDSGHELDFRVGGRRWPTAARTAAP